KQDEKALFHRLGNKINLTEEGELFLEYTNKILVHYQELESNLQHYNKICRKQITIGESTTTAQYLLSQLLYKLKHNYSDTDFELLNANSEDIESLLIDKKLHLGFTEGSATNPSIHYETFVKDEIVLVTKSDNTTLANTDEINLNQLKSIPLVLREKG